MYAVEPEGVAAITPSHESVPRSSPPTDQPTVTIRPSVELVATQSFTAVCVFPPTSASSVGSSTTTKSPASARVRPDSKSSASTAVRKPTLPKLIPNTGTPVSRLCFSARSIVPSPPSTTIRSASPSGTTSTPAARATSSTRLTASPSVSGLP